MNDETKLDLTINTPRTDTNVDEDDEDERDRGEVVDDFEDSGGGGNNNGKEADYHQKNRHNQHEDEDEDDYPYTSDSGHQKHLKTNKNQTITSNQKPTEKINHTTNEKEIKNQDTIQQQLTLTQKQQQQKLLANSGTKYKNNILNYYFNDKSVNQKNLNNLTPRYFNI